MLKKKKNYSVTIMSDGQGSLVCCSPWGCKESDMTEQLNWTIIKLKKKASKGQNWFQVICGHITEQSPTLLKDIQKNYQFNKINVTNGHHPIKKY